MAPATACRPPASRSRRADHPVTTAMSVNLFRPTSAVARISKRLHPTRLAPHVRIGLVVVVVAATAIFVFEPLQGMPRLGFAHLVLLVAQASAAVSCIIAFRALPRGRRA